MAENVQKHMEKYQKHIKNLEKYLNFVMFYIGCFTIGISGYYLYTAQTFSDFFEIVLNVFLKRPWPEDGGV